MAKVPDAKKEQARGMFLSGKKLIEIAEALGIPEGTVRSWKNRYKWGDNSYATLQKARCNVAKEKDTKKKAVAEEVDQVIDNPDLTDKQRLFCVLYTRCFNATKAYQKAYGVDYLTANAHGYELLSKVVIKEEIQRLKQHRLNREMLDETDIFQKYMDIAFSDMTDYVEFGREEVPVMGAFGPVEVEDADSGEKVPLTREVNCVKFKESVEVDGTLITEVKQGKDGASIKLADRMRALDWIAAHMDLSTAEQKARINALRAKVEDKSDRPIHITFTKAGEDVGK